MSISRQAIIHIGAPKAGSSSIQGFLKANYLHWKTLGVLAAGMTGAKSGLNHRSLYFSFHQGSISRADRMRFHSPSEYAEHRDSQRMLLSRELTSTPECQTVVFSDEYLTRLSLENIKELKTYLESHGVSRFLILAYVRDPGSLFLSSAQQSIKANHELPTPVGWRHEFSEILATWQSVFPSSTSFRAYERSSLKGESVVEDFLDALASTDSTLNLKEDSISTKDSHNVSLTAEGMAILLAYRKKFHRDRPHTFTPDTRQLILCLQECAASDEFKTARLRTAWKDYIESNHAAELLRLASEFKIRYRHIDYDDLKSRVSLPPLAAPDIAPSPLPEPLRDVALLVEEVSPADYESLSLMAFHKLAGKAAENSRLKKALKDANNTPEFPAATTE